MRKLILVRHSAPEIVPGVPANEWHLSNTGRRRCVALAETLAAHDPALVCTSLEPKAIETGSLVAGILGIPLETAPSLHEHDRRDVGFLQDQKQFRAQVAHFFEYPDDLVFGYETADEAHSRFSRALRAVIEGHRTGTLVVVSHGTVMTLFVARAAGLDPVPLWNQLGLPSFFLLSLPDFDVLELVTSLPAET